MGGWNTTITQDTKLTPKVVKAAIFEFLTFMDHFNDWLKNNGHHKIRMIGPMGSTYYCFKEDLKHNPNRIYGDVDYLVVFPILKKIEDETNRDHENRSIKFYRDKLQEFFKNQPIVHNYVYNTTREIILDVQEKYVVVQTPDGPVQIDVLVSLPEYSDWMSKRYVPPKNLKGVVLGSLFSAINHAYGIMIGDRGVVIRIQDGKLVQRKRKNVDIRTITLDYSELWIDMFYWFGNYIDNGVSHNNYYLTNYEGINIGDNMLEQACFGLVGFCQALEESKLLGNDIFPEKTAKKMLFKISEEYSDITFKQYYNPKLDKAKTEKAIISATKFKEDINIGRDIVSRILS